MYDYNCVLKLFLGFSSVVKWKIHMEIGLLLNRVMNYMRKRGNEGEKATQLPEQVQCTKKCSLWYQSKLSVGKIHEILACSLSLSLPLSYTWLNSVIYSLILNHNCCNMNNDIVIAPREKEAYPTLFCPCVIKDIQIDSTWFELVANSIAITIQNE